jgi:hypothetical protein
MNWRICAVAAIAGLAVLATASPALAKGADQAIITGPGLSKPIVVGGNGEPGSSEGLGELADGSGLFVAMFGPNSGGAASLASTAPVGSLGAKYELTFRVPGGNPKPDTVRQDLYPLAAGGPVTFTPGGQSVLGTKTTGGWYRAPATFNALLKSLGVPDLVGAVASAPARPQPTSVGNVAGNATPAHSPPWLAIIAGAIGACVLAAAVMLIRRSSRARLSSQL